MLRLYADYTSIINQTVVINKSKFVAFKKFVGYKISFNLNPWSLIKSEDAVNSDPLFSKNIKPLKLLSIKNDIVCQNLIVENLNPKEFYIFRINNTAKEHFKKEGLWCLPYTSSLFYGYEDPFFFDEKSSPLLQIHHNHSVVFNREILVKKNAKDNIQVLNSPYFA